ncbi:hypothetical protein [Gordonia liuliyuniae]|uniref:Dolichyl-phosphate-mannose-protein mannosyltransferase n=1 Tax=Gordonia liuliyuniae TaxID=2911517 RepID=A0ABS9IMZ6_9ACTN|nr:hypothetical protein [Gordonia liuliyuniae]MCF8586933.1 hypothetical protein [Gordonia liuliyuniae]
MPHARTLVPAAVVPAAAVVPIAGALLVAQLVVRAWLVARGNFYWDDLVLISQASSDPILSWDYLGSSHDGHFMPGAFLVAGVSTVIAPVQWWLPAATLVVLQAIASLAVWRMIRIITPRAGVAALAAFAFYLFVPMTISAYVWWAAGLNTLPMQAALAYVVGNAILLVRDDVSDARRTRLVVCAVAAFVIALTFFEKSLLILPVAFVAALLATRRRTNRFEHPDTDYRTSALTVTFTRARNLWAILGTVFVAWAVLFFATTTATEGSHSFSQTAHLVWRSINNAIVPSFAGGPWNWERWVPSPPMGLAPVWMIVLGWVIIAVLVVSTVRATRGAVAVWVCAALYAVLAQAPVLWTRSGEFTSLELAQTMRYLPDTALVFTIAFALIAAAPSASGTHAAASEPDRRPTIAVAVGAVLLVVSSMIATSAYSTSWREDPTADYLANARQAMKDNAGRTMFDQAVPLEVLLPVAYPDNQISRIFGRLPERPEFGSYTDDLVVLDPTGKATQGAVTRARTIEPSAGSCRRPGIAGPERLALDGPLLDLQWTLQISYCADRDGEIEVRLDGGDPLQIPVQSGLHVVYAQLTGHGDGVQIRPVTPGLHLHTGEGRVGNAVMAGLAP